jgi:hypothetical protein
LNHGGFCVFLLSSSISIATKNWFGNFSQCLDYEFWLKFIISFLIFTCTQHFSFPIFNPRWYLWNYHVVLQIVIHTGHNFLYEGYFTCRLDWKKSYFKKFEEIRIRVVTERFAFTCHPNIIKSFEQRVTLRNDYIGKRIIWKDLIENYFSSHLMQVVIMSHNEVDKADGGYECVQKHHDQFWV